MILGEMPKKRDSDSSSLAEGIPQLGAEFARGKTLGPLTPPQFAAKWSGSTRTERAAAQEHFIDLCRMLGVPTPNDADPHGTFYAFEKGADKTAGGDGFADVWKRQHFAWEYKRKKKNLAEAYNQLLQYREALENPPLLVVCDLDRFQVHTNFTNTVKKVYEFRLADIADDPQEPLRVLRALMNEPESLRPNFTRKELTERAAKQFADLAHTLRKQHAPLAVAHFMDKLVFCMFAQHAGLLPARLIERLAETAKQAPKRFAEGLRDLFAKMSAEGGLFGADEIQWFNGGLFDGAEVLPLTTPQIEVVQEVAGLDWSQIEPALLGTLFERGLDPDKRSQLGAHYTDRASIELLVGPVVIAPLRRELEEMKVEVEEILAKPTPIASDDVKRRARENARKRFRAFLDRLSRVTVLDPACGSGNFLYVTLHSLKNLEREAILWGSQRFKLAQEMPRVGPQAVLGIELNEYAAELARVSIWIGEIQWMLNNGFNYLRNPVLRPLQNIKQGDAILDRTDPTHPVEPMWEPAEFIVGNPPHVGSKHMRERGIPDAYVRALQGVYKGQVSAESDLACYWFEKARKMVESGTATRVGLIGPQGIRGGANRKVLDRIKETGDVFFALPDRDWVVDGAQTHVSLVGFDDGSEVLRMHDGKPVSSINADLTTGLDLTKVPRLAENLDISFMGDSKGGAFDITPEVARDLLSKANPHRKPNADVVVPWMNGASVTKQPKERWIIDFGVTMSKDDAALYEAPFEYVRKNVWPKRKTNPRQSYAEKWWIHVEPRPKMRRSYAGLDRFVGTVRHAKHRIFFWIPKGTLPDSALIVFARDDDYFFGVLQSRIHSVWSLAKGTQVRERETGFRYTPSTTFETFPFPRPTKAQEEKIATAAKALETFRQGWLRPKAGPVRSLTQLYTESPTWLQQRHGHLDAAVAGAYGWPADLPDDEILSRLMALNAERKPATSASDDEDEGDSEG
jgi:type II restriction/modification system DNA methylase subunit YeeA